MSIEHACQSPRKCLHSNPVRTDEVVEAQERPRELMVVLHDDPYPRANTPIDQL